MMSLTDPSDDPPLNGISHVDSEQDASPGSTQSEISPLEFKLSVRSDMPTSHAMVNHLEGIGDMSSLEHLSLTRCSEESYLKSIFDNFNDLYRSKIKWIQKTMPDGNDPSVIAAKKDVLESWITDMIAQNSALIKTIGDLELEAEKKTEVLQRKVREAAAAAGEHMTMIREYEEQIKHLADQKVEMENEAKVLRDKEVQQQLEKSKLLKKAEDLDTENTNLITLINRVRDTGVWNTDDLELPEHTYDSIFGLYPSLVGSEVKPVFTLQKALNAEMADNHISKLESEIKELESIKREVLRLISSDMDPANVIASLQRLVIAGSDDGNFVDRALKNQEDASLKPELALAVAKALPTNSTASGDAVNVEELIRENEFLKDQNEQLMKTNLNLVNEKAEAISNFEHELQQKDIEITMQKAAEAKEVFRNLLESIRKLQIEIRSLEQDELLYRSLLLLSRVDADQRQYCGDFACSNQRSDTDLLQRKSLKLEKVRRDCENLKCQLSKECDKLQDLWQDVKNLSEHEIYGETSMKEKTLHPFSPFDGLIVNGKARQPNFVHSGKKFVFAQGEKQPRSDSKKSHVEKIEQSETAYSLASTTKSQSRKLEKRKSTARSGTTGSGNGSTMDSKDPNSDTDASSSLSAPNLSSGSGTDSSLAAITKGDSALTVADKLARLVNALRKKLEKKKEREILHALEKEALIKLMGTVISTWETLRGGYNVLQQENTLLQMALGGTQQFLPENF